MHISVLGICHHMSNWVLQLDLHNNQPFHATTPPRCNKEAACRFSLLHQESFVSSSIGPLYVLWMWIIPFISMYEGLYPPQLIATGSLAEGGGGLGRMNVSWGKRNGHGGDSQLQLWYGKRQTVRLCEVTKWNHSCLGTCSKVPHFLKLCMNLNYRPSM